MRKSDVSTLTTTKGRQSRTHIEFLSDEYYTKYSSSVRGRRRSFLPYQVMASSPCMPPSSSQNEVFSFYLSLKLNLTRLDWSFQFFCTVYTFFSLILQKKVQRFFSISFSLALRASGFSLDLFFYWLQILIRLSSLLLNSLKISICVGLVRIQSNKEQLLMRQSIEYSQKSEVCSRYWKNFPSSCPASSFSTSCWNCFQKVQQAASSQFSLAVDYWLSFLFWMYASLACQMWSMMLLKTSAPQRSSMLSSDSLQKIKIWNLFSPGLTQISQTLISSSQMSGLLPKFLQEYRKYASQTMSCSNPSK